MDTKIVSRAEWDEERLKLLKKEKEFTRKRDEMSALIRGLPRVKVEKKYTFLTNKGERNLAGLFNNCSQLAVYHFMLGPEWEQGCKSCSFWADNFNGVSGHLKARDVSFVVVSRAPLQNINQFKSRMRWSFEWVSSLGSDFNFDYQVSFKQRDIEKGEAVYNYRKTHNVAGEMPGASFFVKENNAIYHTYSTYGRGLDMLNGSYNWLDLCPKGRDEKDLDHPMAWVKHHDNYSHSRLGAFPKYRTLFSGYTSA